MTWVRQKEAKQVRIQKIQKEGAEYPPLPTPNENFTLQDMQYTALFVYS